ncbi:MAG: c-type cytochrome domain-containing protein [Planctomycetaceae bacterium]
MLTFALSCILNVRSPKAPVLAMAGAMLAAMPGIICAEDEQPIAAEDVQLGRPVDFAQDIYPIFRANCIACHNKGKAEGQLNLESSEALMKGGASGPSVVPGKPDESYLLKVASRQEESFMPPWPNQVQAKKLTPKEVGLLKIWIAEGAKGGAVNSAANMQWQAMNSALKAIYAVDTDPFGRFVAGGRAGNVTIYDLANADNTASLIDPQLAPIGSPQQTAHRDYVHAIAFRPDGEMLATSGFQVVKLWNRDTAHVLQPIDLPAKTVASVTSSDGKLLVALQQDGVLRSIEVASRKVVAEAKSAPDVTLLGVHAADASLVSTASPDHRIHVLSRTDGAEIAGSDPLESRPLQSVFVESSSRLIVLLEDGSLKPLAFNREAKTLTAADAVKSDKGAIRQIALTGDRILCRCEGPVVELRNQDSLQPVATIQSSSPLAWAAISSDAERVVTIAADGRPELWNAKDGKLIATLNSDLHAVRNLKSRTADKAVRDARVNVVKGQITEDEKRVAEQQESLKKSDEEIKKAGEAVAEAKKKLEEATAKTAAAQKASDEKADDQGLKKALEDATKAEQAAKDAVAAAESSVKSAEKGKELTQQAIQRAEQVVADRKALLTKTEEEAKVATEVQAAADTAAKQTVTASLAGFAGTSAVATIDGAGTVRLWKTSDGSALDVFVQTLPEERKPTAVLNAGRELIVQQADGQLMTLNPFPAWQLARILGPQPDNKPSVFVDRVLSLAFSPDGSILAAGGGEASRSGEVTLWNVSDGSLIRSLPEAHSDTVYGLDFSADGKLLATAAADKFVKVFDVATGNHVRSYEGHTHHVMDVSWKGDRTQLVSAGADNAIKVWDAETGEQARTITTYQKQVTALEFIGMEDDFISCSGDKRVFRHKASNGGTVREFGGCPDYVYCSATTADGTIVVAGCEDGILRVWNGANGQSVATFGP